MGVAERSLKQLKDLIGDCYSDADLEALLKRSHYSVEAAVAEHFGAAGAASTSAPPQQSMDRSGDLPASNKRRMVDEPKADSSREKKCCCASVLSPAAGFGCCT